MRIESIISLLEDLAFEILSWVFYLPYTLVRSLVPGGAHQIVAARRAEGPGGAASAMSPLVYYFVVFALVIVGAEGGGELPLDRLAGLAQLELLIAALSILLLPFLFTLPLWWARSLRWGTGLARSELRRLFEVQVLLWPILLATFVVGWLLWGALDPSRDGFGWLFILVLLAGTAYFLFLEGWTLQQELSEKQPQAGVAVAAGFAAAFVVLGLFLGLLWLTADLWDPFIELFAESRPQEPAGPWPLW